MVRMSMELVEAQADVAKYDYLAAERRLLRVYGLAPPGAVERSSTNLLMALISLRLGNPQAAAELAPTAVAHVGSLRVYANPSERAYLKYAGRLIFEEATRQLGAPKTLSVGVDYEDLDMRKVRNSLRDTYRVPVPAGLDTPQAH
jgi:hypothetical protein